MKAWLLNDMTGLDQLDAEGGSRSASRRRRGSGFES